MTALVGQIFQKKMFIALHIYIQNNVNLRHKYNHLQIYGRILNLKFKFHNIHFKLRRGGQLYTLRYTTIPVLTALYIPNTSPSHTKSIDTAWEVTVPVL